MSQRWLFGSWLALVTACSSAPEAPPDAGTAATPDAGFVLDFPLTGDSVARGEQLYRGLRCANCHGVDGRGSPTFPGAPVLVGRTADDLQTALVDACENSTALGGCHPLKLPGVELSHLEDVAAFLLALAAASSDDPGPPCDRASGKICTFAGAGNAGNKKTLGITAREQSLFWPQDAQLDPQGRLVIMDWNNYLLRRVDACGDGDCPVLNIVGNATLGDDCSTPARRVLAPNTAMNHPVGASFFPNGDLVLWGWHMWKIKVFPIQPDGSYGEVLCMFGNGRGFAGDGQAAGTNFNGMGGPSRFNLPSSAVVDRDGNWYISDQGNFRIRIVRANADDAPFGADARTYVATHKDNIVETFAGGEPRTPSGESRKTRADYSDSGDGGPAFQATFRLQAGFDAVPQMRLAYDRDRHLLYVADSENHRIRVIDLNVDPPTIDTFAGGGDDLGSDLPARQVKLFRPADVDIIPDGSGDVLITDSWNNCVRVVDRASLRVRTIAGVCGPENEAYAGDGALATAAKLAQPGGAGAGPDRTIYIADTLNHRIRRVNP